MPEARLKAADVEITGERAVFGDIVFPIADIRAVRLGREKARPLWGALAFVAGVVMVFQGQPAGWLVLLVGAGLVAYMLRTRTTLVISTSSGDRQAFASRDAAHVARVKSAIEQAMADRGEKG